MSKDILDTDGFSVIKRLGTGARTTIYLAIDEQTKEKVALKRCILEKPEDSRIFEQICTEYRVSKSFSHPYIRRCLKLVKRRSFLRVSEVLLSMEYFDGVPLEEAPPVSLGDVLLLFRMIATALNTMHEKGVIHCDIKPNNILISKDYAIKIIDLGQSCRVGTTKPRIQGTPDYIAPEQVLRQPLEQRTDIFNLGATMYWSITGRNIPTLIPMKNDSLVAIEVKPFAAPHEIHRKIPPGVSKLVMDCVKNRPEERPGRMLDVISRLDLLIHSIFGDKMQRNVSNNT
ncbi:MAG: serine/threonine-protein kinase [Planctomycetota bacterium]